MKLLGRWVCLVLAGIVVLAVWAGARTGPVSFEKKRVQDVPVDVIRVDLTRAKVRTEVAQGLAGSLEGFRSFMKRTHPLAAINGGYFHPNGMPTGDLVVRGKLVAYNVHRTGLCVTKSGRVSIQTRPKGSTPAWPGFESVVCAGPRLLRDGRVALDPRSEGFGRRSIRVCAVRTAVGITSDNHLLMVVTRKEVTLAELASVMKALGAADAINFDGGGSTAMYYQGKVLNEPATRLSNVLLAQ